MTQHLLRVTRPVVEFESLIVAMRQGGDRVGWLELPSVVGPYLPPEPVPDSLAAAAGYGAAKAVAVSGLRSVAVKPMFGQPVMLDILREHFRGCSLVLVMGEADAPCLEPQGDGWLLTTSDGPKPWTTERLISVLAKPRPW